MSVRKIQHPPETVALALRAYIETNGNARRSAEIAGVSHTAVLGWVKRGDWGEILEAQRREVEAQTAAEALRQIVTIRELRVNIHYRALAFIHQRIQEWEAQPELERGAFPFDPLKLADAMAKADQGSGSSQAAAVEVEDPMAAHVPA